MMLRKVLNDKVANITSKIVLLLFLVFYLAFSMLLSSAPKGESGSFTLATVSLIESGDYAITEQEYEKAIQLMPTHKEYLDTYFHTFLPRDDEGNIYPWYFGIYAILCVPAFAIFNLLQLDVTYSFAVTNAILLCGALYVVYRECRLKPVLKLLLVIFLGVSPVIRYIQWQSYEVATCAFVMVSMVFWFTDRRKLGALCLSLAGTMNPTAMGFGIFMILEYLIERLRENSWNVSKFIRQCFVDWKGMALYALCFVPCLIPLATTYMHFKRFNMVTMTGVTDYAGVPARMVAYLLDLNYGLLPYIPLVLIMIGIIAVWGIYKKNWKFISSVMGIVVTLAAFSITRHINCGMSGIARYNAWLLPMILCTVIYAIQQDVLHPFPNKCLIGLVWASACWCLFTVSLVAYCGYDNAYYWSPYAEKILQYAPELYNPLPSTFNCRVNHIDGGYDINEPVIYVGKDGYVRKILVPNSYDIEAIGGLVVGELDQAFFDKECKKMQDTEGFCYLNFPIGTTIEYVKSYSLGNEILFTDESNGTKYFEYGISGIENNFAWSDGLESQIKLKIENTSGDIFSEFDFLNVYGGEQTLVVSCEGQELFHDVVTQENPRACFVIPQKYVGNGIINLQLKYPDAVDVSQISNYNDTRVLAFGWSRITFRELNNMYTVGEEIVFTDQEDGTKYFQTGISGVETDFAWSDGYTSIMNLRVGEILKNLDAEFLFKSVYQDEQTIIVRSNGRELFNNVVTQDEPEITFTIPKECIIDGVLLLEISYPDATSPLELGESSDSRILAVGYDKVVLTPTDE